MKISSTDRQEKYSAVGGLSSPTSNHQSALGQSSFNDWSNDEIGLQNSNEKLSKESKYNRIHNSYKQ